MNEAQFILRLPPKLAEKLQFAVGSKAKEKAANRGESVPSFSIKWLSEREAVFASDGVEYPATLVDLPSICETQKTADKKTFFKSGDVHQVLLVRNPEDDHPTHTLLKDGLTKASKGAGHRFAPLIPTYNQEQVTSVEHQLKIVLDKKIAFVQKAEEAPPVPEHTEEVEIEEVEPEPTPNEAVKKEPMKKEPKLTPEKAPAEKPASQKPKKEAKPVKSAPVSSMPALGPAKQEPQLGSTAQISVTSSSADGKENPSPSRPKAAPSQPALTDPAPAAELQVPAAEPAPVKAAPPPEPAESQASVEAAQAQAQAQAEENEASLAEAQKQMEIVNLQVSVKNQEKVVREAEEQVGKQSNPIMRRRLQAKLDEAKTLLEKHKADLDRVSSS